jgi:hypothetical protein
MNLVGKILNVLILVMSVIFMAFAVAVYATHKNWRDVVERPREQAGPGKEAGLKYQLEDARNDYEKLQGEKNSLEATLTAEKVAAAQALAKLYNEYNLATAELERLRKDLDDSDQERRSALAGMEENEKRLAALRAEVEGDGQTPGLRERKARAEQLREQYFNEMVRLTNEWHQAVNEMKRLRDYQQVLRQDLDKAAEVLQKFELKPEPELYAEQPPPVEGCVQATLGDKLVEISIGSDDGLLPKHTLEVYRPTGYVGRIEVLRTDPDRAVCQVIPGYQKSRVQKDDLVTSRLLR